MKNHVKIYLNHFKYDISSFIECEICSHKAVDIHHIEARGMGGTSKKDDIENLMALCRQCHVQYGDITSLKDYLKKIHKLRLDIRQ